MWGGASKSEKTEQRKGQTKPGESRAQDCVFILTSHVGPVSIQTLNMSLHFVKICESEMTIASVHPLLLHEREELVSLQKHSGTLLIVSWPLVAPHTRLVFNAENLKSPGLSFHRGPSPPPACST